MSKIDNRFLAARLWDYQAERSPLIPMIIMAAVTVGVLWRFSHASVWRYTASVIIVVLYLIQIRASDEKKDFEHDNQFYRSRPVQRGLVTLGELNSVKWFAVWSQLLLYASFLNWRILLPGLISQGYAYLTRKEFFVRNWIREHFFIYNFSHYIQLIILFFAILNIIEPTGRTYGQLLLFTVLNIAVVELGRKTLAKEADVAKDTYSYYLGYRGTAIAVTVASIINLAVTSWLIWQNPRSLFWLALPALAFLAIVSFANRFGIRPNKSNQELMENSVLLGFVVAMVSVILGAKF